MSQLWYSVVVPVFNEGPNIAAFCAKAKTELPPDYELLICYDFEADNTLPALAAIPPEEKPANIRLVKNDLGKGVRYAIEAGMRAAAAPVVVVMMADLSDDFPKVRRMVELAQEGHDVVCASRYMPGGQQVGGPFLKGLMSRTAGISLHYLTGIPTHDPTNSFKAYRKEFLERTPIESTAGFCLGMELTVKAYFESGRVCEVPATWQDRTAGESRFQLLKWLPMYLHWYFWALERSRRTHVLLMSLIAILAVAFGWTHYSLRPDYHNAEDVLLGEIGNPLYRADRLAEGRLLYRDVACQYGPLGPYLYTAFTGLFGNSLRTAILWHLLTSTTAILLMFTLIRRALPLVSASVFTLLAVFPLMLVPGGTLGGYTNSEHLSLERIALLSVMLAWQPPPVRGLRISFVLGICLGLCQWLKFGGAFYAGAAVLLIDTVWLLRVRTPESPWSHWLRCLAVTLAGFLLLQGLLVGFAYAFLPSWLAFETLWPSYMLTAYSIYPARYPGWIDLHYFFGYQMLPLLCFTLGFFRSERAGTNHREYACLLGIAFFLLASTSYFAHRHLYYQYAWLLLPFGALGIAGLNTRSRLTLAPLFAMSWLAMIQLTFLTPVNPTLQPIKLPTGDIVYATEEFAQEWQRVSAALQGKRILPALGWGGGGLLHTLSQQYPLRNPFIDGVAFRVADRQELVAQVTEFQAIVFRSDWLRELGGEKAFFQPILREDTDAILAQFRPVPELTGSHFTVWQRR